MCTSCPDGNGGYEIVPEGTCTKNVVQPIYPRWTEVRTHCLIQLLSCRKKFVSAFSRKKFRAKKFHNVS